MAENEELKGCLAATEAELETQKQRVRDMWRESCLQVSEHDRIVSQKDAEIADLQHRLRAATSVSISSEPERTFEELHTVSGSSRVRRESVQYRQQRGKAPPVDSFTGEDAEIRLDDWLPFSSESSRLEWVDGGRTTPTVCWSPKRAGTAGMEPDL